MKVYVSVEEEKFLVERRLNKMTEKYTTERVMALLNREKPEFEDVYAIIRAWRKDMEDIRQLIELIEEDVTVKKK